MKSRMIALLFIPSLIFQIPPINYTNKIFEIKLEKEVQLPSFKSDRERFESLEKESERVYQVRLEEERKIKEDQEKLKRERVEIEKQKQQEVESKKKSNSRSVEGRKVKFSLSFYTSLPDENGGYTVTCTGKPLVYGIVASNYYKLGTKIYLDGIGEFTVADRGGSHFNSPNRLDVLIPRRPGESNSAYKRRVNNLGRPTVMGWVK